MSRVLGLLRDIRMADLFGNNQYVDAFTVAFRIPNLARAMLGEGALATAFLPAFIQEQEQVGPRAADRLASAVFLVLAAGLTIGVILAELVLLAILHWCPLTAASGLLLRLTAWMLPYVILICLAAQLCAVLHAGGRFLWPALIPVLLNVFWLVSLDVVARLWTEPGVQIERLAASVILGGSCQLLLPIAVLWKAGHRFQTDWLTALTRVRQVLGEVLPVVAGLSITQLNTLLDSAIAWGFSGLVDGPATMPLPGSPRWPLAEGTASALYYGQRFYQFPLGVFGVALVTVLYPLLTRHAQRGEEAAYRNVLTLGIRLVLAIGIPASAGLMLLAIPITRFFFLSGKFTAADAQVTGQMIAAYGAGVWAFCALLVVQRGFYALGDRVTPLRVGLWTMAMNAVLNLVLIWPCGGMGLAVATTVTSAIQCVISGWLLERKAGALPRRPIVITLLKSLVASLAMVAVCLVAQSLLPSWLAGVSAGWPQKAVLAVELAVPFVAGLVTFLAVAAAIGLREPWMLLRGQHQDWEQGSPNPSATTNEAG